MSYEKLGFNPLHGDGDGFPILHTTLREMQFHVVDMPQLLSRAGTAAGVLLVEAELSTGSFATGLRATVALGKNLDGEDARLYTGAVDLVPGASSRGKFERRAKNLLTPGLNVERGGGYKGARVYRYHDGLTTGIVYDKDNEQIVVANQITHTSGGAGRLVLNAPGVESVDPEGQLLHYLSGLMAAADIGHGSGTFKDYPFLGLDDFVLTPDGPLYRHPDTGEYVHRLKPESIITGGQAPQPDAKKGANTPEKARVRTLEDTTFDDLYGIDGIKERLEPLLLCYKYPDIVQKWGGHRPSGLLLEGPPRTGKSSLVYALAHAIGAEVRLVRPEQIHQKYIGESQRRVAAIFEKAREITTPVILFFDKFDVLFPTTTSTEGSSPAVNAVAAIFKLQAAEIGQQHPNIIIAAATNRPERIDEDQTSSGLFDVRLVVGLPNPEARRAIWSGLILEGMGTRDFTPEHVTNGVAPSTDAFQRFDSKLLDPEALAELADATEGFNGGDVVNLINQALLSKIRQEVMGQSPGPVSLADLRFEIARMRTKS